MVAVPLQFPPTILHTSWNNMGGGGVEEFLPSAKKIKRQ